MKEILAMMAQNHINVRQIERETDVRNSFPRFASSQIHIISVLHRMDALSIA